jgi:phage FluMu protein Com
MSWKENKALGGILAIVAIAAIGLLVLQMMPAEQSNMITLQCTKCYPTQQVATVAGLEFPLKCTKCNAEAAVFPTMKLHCAKCNKDFNIVDAGDGQISKALCPECKTPLQQPGTEEENKPQ